MPFSNAGFTPVRSRLISLCPECIVNSLVKGVLVTVVLQFTKVAAGLRLLASHGLKIKVIKKSYFWKPHF